MRNTVFYDDNNFLPRPTAEMPLSVTADRRNRNMTNTALAALGVKLHKFRVSDNF